MTIACQTVTVTTPAAITATNMALSTTSCTEPCSVVATITWTNNGGTEGTFTPGVILDGGIPQTIAAETLAAGGSVTHAFSITGLTAGSHGICPSPN
jgi:hypothetical protein